MTRYFGVAAALTLLGLVAAFVFGDASTLAAVALLAVLEISLSFDNAVVNAKVLQRMHPTWQKLFLTVGVVIAVFGMRLVFPLLIVSLTASLSPAEVIDLALNKPTEYGNALHGAQHVIYAFGGTFLLMIFLDFLTDTDRDVVWLRPVDGITRRLGDISASSIIVALGTLLAISAGAADKERSGVLTAGALGLLTYLLVSGLDGLFEGSMESREEHGDPVGAAAGGAFGGAALKAGLFAFLYLEVLDASFSFDGVIGAFAISNEILVISLGLGIGAFWIRSMTVYLVRKGTLADYPYLEHGAHYAIGALALVMLTEILGYSLPEVVTGLIGVAFILFALISSVRRREASGDGDTEVPLAEAQEPLPVGGRGGPAA